jgi:hypothetical protein
MRGFFCVAKFWRSRTDCLLFSTVCVERGLERSVPAANGTSVETLPAATERGNQHRRR